MSDDLDWTEDGAPRSRRFDDVYFSKADGLAESRAVFLRGCGLPEAWRGRERFVVGELGFGTGLNVLALLALWRRERPAGARLHVFSVEAFPMRVAQVAQALGAWPELADLAAPLLARWPEAAGVRRVDWPELDAVLDVAVADVGPALDGWDGRADAWFLDGFSPAKNPEMWSDAVMARVAARSAPSARLATFSVAGAVRRALTEAGFAVERRPGHAGKRQRLEAVLERPSGPALVEAWRARPRVRTGEVLVVGGGIAGAAVARALGSLGREPTVLAGPGAGASGNAAALVTPRYELGDSPGARLHAQAFRRAVDLYGEEDGVVLRRGVRQLGDAEARDRFARLAGSALFLRGELTAEDDALLARDALVIDPRPLVARWLDGARRIEGEAAGLEHDGERWVVRDAAGDVLATAETVVLAAGSGLRALAPELPLQPVRGQVSWAPGAHGPAAAWGGYCAPTPAGLLFGATHDRDVEDATVRAEDHARNLATLRARLPEVAAAVDRAALEGRASVRAATPDRLPLAGPVPDAAAFAQTFAGLAYGRAPPEADPCVRPGLWVLGGLGSRGFTTAPLLGEHVAAWITGAPSPLPDTLAAAVHPAHYLVRSLKRGRGSGGALV